MAKLSAHGRTELLRLERAYPLGDSRHTIAVMSDGAVLQKYDDGAYHSGWRRKSTIRVAVSLVGLRRYYESRGYQVVSELKSPAYTPGRALERI